ncbi:MAG: PIN domain-containing protein [Pirellulales bacterium]
MLILIDTSIVVRAVETGHRDHSAATNALRELRQAGHGLFVVPQIHYEFWVVATRPVDQNGLGMSTAVADAELARLAPPLFRLLQDERAIYGEWRRLVSQHDVKGKKAHDTRLAAAAKRHALTHILTFNAGDFGRYSEITVLTPADVLTQTLP